MAPQAGVRHQVLVLFALVLGMTSLLVTWLPRSMAPAFNFMTAGVLIALAAAGGLAVLTFVRASPFTATEGAGHSIERLLRATVLTTALASLLWAVLLFWRKFD